MGQAEGPRAAMAIARQDSNAMSDLTGEIVQELMRSNPDPEMVLPLCKEIQGRAQSVYNRVAQTIGDEDGQD